MIVTTKYTYTCSKLIHADVIKFVGKLPTDAEVFLVVIMNCFYKVQSSIEYGDFSAILFKTRLHTSKHNNFMTVIQHNHSILSNRYRGTDRYTMYAR